MDLSSYSLGAIVAAFLAAAMVIGVAGSRLTRIADRLADATGLGEAVFGAVLLGGTTSLPGLVASATAAWQGHPELAVSNAVGGIAAQTVFLAAADLAWRRANLEHAAASVANLMQGALLLILLALPMLALGSPDLAVGHVHPVSLLLVAGYLFGVRMIRRAEAEPLWRPILTPETRADEPEADPLQGGSLGEAWLTFAALGLVVAVAGYAVAETGLAIAGRTGLSESVVGTYVTAIATSLPELVTSVAAARQGALTLAVGGIIGGNSFDVLFLSLADAVYLDGPIFGAVSERQLFTLALAMVMTGILLLGLLRREREGPARLGSETLLLLAAYASAVALDMWRG